MNQTQQTQQTATALSSGKPANELPKEWLRVSEAVQFSRISKPKLYDLMNRSLIKSCSLKERGMVRGTRLISFDSLRAFLESRASGGEILPPQVH
jgi:hypothetical protein